MPESAHIGQKPESESELNRRSEIKLTRCPDIVLVTGTKKGRGVFATSSIPSRTILDISPVLVLDPEEVEQHVRHTRFWFHTFNWPLQPPPAPPSSTPPPAAPASYTSTTKPQNPGSRSTTQDSHSTPPPTPPPPPSPPPSRRPAAPSLKTQALPLGLGALFNHSIPHQNVGWTRNVSDETITYITLRDICKGEELCICYGEGGRLGFVDVDEEEEEAVGKDGEEGGEEAPNVDVGFEALRLGLDDDGDDEDDEDGGGDERK